MCLDVLQLQKHCYTVFFSYKIKLEESKIDIYINDIHIAHEGKAVRFSKESVITSMNEKEIKIKIDLNVGDYSGIAWGCDLTEEYVIFNSAYST